MAWDRTVLYKRRNAIKDLNKFIQLILHKGSLFNKFYYNVHNLNFLKLN